MSTSVYEITFTIANEHKVLNNNDDLNILFATNDLVNVNDTYLITIQHKEMIVFS